MTDHSPGGGGLLSIMRALLKTGGPSNTEKRKIGGPGVYGDLWDIRRKMKQPIRREMKTAGKTPARIRKHSNCSEILCFSAVFGCFLNAFLSFHLAAKRPGEARVVNKDLCRDAPGDLDFTSSFFGCFMRFFRKNSPYSADYEYGAI